MISLCGVPLSAPSLVTQCGEFFRLGWAMRVVLPTGDGGVVHLFSVNGYQGRRRILRSFRLPMSCNVLFLQRLGWCVWCSRCLL